MFCPNCKHEISLGAQFCGNCGQPFIQPQSPQVAPQAPIPQPVVQPISQPPSLNAPVAPVASVDSAGGTKAIISFILGILGFVGSLIPIVGLIMGIVALVLGLSSRNSSRKGLATAGFILAIFVILLSVVFWVLAIYVEIKAEEFKTLEYSGHIFKSLVEQIF